MGVHTAATPTEPLKLAARGRAVRCCAVRREWRGLTVAWLLAAGVGLLLGSGTMAWSAAPGSDKMAELELGTVEQRAEALLWLAEHGDQSTAHAVVQHLKDADATIRGLAEQTAWAIWMRSGNVEVDMLMQEGINLMGEREYEEATTIFTEVIQRLPSFAEGYNKRATLYYLAGDYLHSLDDVEATLKLNPEHFGALSGAGLCLLRLQRPAEALQYFERALAVNPNMDSIRFMADQLRKQKPKPLI